MLHDTIAATNVRPTFEVSLAFGATEPEIERACGLTRAALQDDDATVPADATYAHLELMFGKPDFGRFLVAAASTHTLASLGVVGLACKTVATLGEALACHARFGHLTNRTASYSAAPAGDHLELVERRVGPPRLGSLLVSDYAMLIAAHLLRESTPDRPRVLAMHSRRARIDDDERRCYEAFVGAPVRTGAELAALWLEPDLLACPVPSADPELARYFTAILERAAGFGADEDPLLRRVRLAIRDALVHGSVDAATIARTLGLGARTLQRRLGELGTRYADVLESTRRALAEGYLRDPSLGLAEIAWLLGYDEQTSFFRAFRRWHGRTPGEYRSALGDAVGSRGQPFRHRGPAGL
ncbi:MAG: AraC family transcriptional regulator ligand-binding domain-containing protein [Myxococcales bacterium]|jgi:AraC-like DNA-binding protein|nr:AraC family transcriptional regulator ligand-binding domain-containing protein [Myxococcales bacterium]